MMKCGECRYYNGCADFEGECHGLPPQIHVSYPNGNETVESFRPTVKVEDLGCSLFDIDNKDYR